MKTKKEKHQKTDAPKSHSKQTIKETDIKLSASVKSQDIKKKLAISFYIFVAGFILLVGGYFWYSQSYTDKIYPNINIGDMKLGGADHAKAVSILSEQAKDFSWKADIKDDKNNYHFSSADIDLGYDTQKTFDKLFTIGRSGDTWQDIKTRLKLLFFRSDQLAVFDINLHKFYHEIDKIYQAIHKPVEDARFVYEDDQVVVVEESEGVEIDQDKLTEEVFQSIGQFENHLETEVVKHILVPKITKAELDNIFPKIKQATDDIILLTSEIKEVEISKNDIFSYIDIVATSKSNDKVSFFSKAKANEVLFEARADVSISKIKRFLENIKKDINKDAKDARLTFSDGKVSVFQSPEKGYELDELETAKRISDLVVARMGVKGESTHQIDVDSNSLEMVLKTTEPDVSDTNFEKFGIKELVGTGTTSFHGSSASRVFNIKHGADQFHGLLVKPGDTLSTMKILGNPTAEAGYLPELVIKGNRTIPEYGGGLCQVSTTLFRVALNSGFDIVERYPHAYRVGYYEPPVGMDATIYYPKPDFIFKNNTDHHILIQARVEGYKITFDFYGTKGDRHVEISDPVITETIPALGDRYVESADLGPGEIVKKETAKVGARVVFYYKVTVNGKLIIDQAIKSYYSPWQGLYLYGPGTSGIPGVSDHEPEENQEEQPQPEENQEEQSQPEENQEEQDLNAD